MKRKLVVFGVFALVAWVEFVTWRASRAETRERLPARSEAVVVPGYRNARDKRANALNARLYLRHQRPDLADRLVRTADYRLGEAWPLKPLFALYGLVDLVRAKRNLAHRGTNGDAGGAAK